MGYFWWQLLLIVRGLLLDMAVMMGSSPADCVEDGVHCLPYVKGGRGQANKVYVALYC